MSINFSGSSISGVENNRKSSRSLYSLVFQLSRKSLVYMYVVPKPGAAARTSST